MMKNLCVGLAVIALAACGGGGGDSNGPPPPPQGNTPAPTGGITVQNNSYSPSSKTVAPGTTVEWAWNSCVSSGGYDGEICTAHSVTFADGATSSLQDRGTYSRTFATAGTYDYHCTSHGTAMTGRITVQ